LDRPNTRRAFRPISQEETTMTQPQVATVPAAVEAALSAQQVTTAKECGARFFNSKIEAIETARVYAKEVIGIEPSYDQWEQGRINWCNGYVEANPENTGNAADAEWKTVRCPVA
jgi:hypothetical protein